MNTPYAKLGATLTYVWRDFNTTRRAAVAPYTVVYRWVNAAENSGGHGVLPANDPILSAHAVASTINPSATNQPHTFQQGSSATLNIYARLYPIGVTQGVAIDGQQVGVMVSGLTPLIVFGRVDPGDLLVAVASGGTATAAELVPTFTNNSPLFQRVPHIRPLLHPYWGREVTMLATQVRSFNRLNRGSIAFDANARIFVIGVAETGSTADTEYRIITARLEPHVVY